jgi:hypothetical protein
LVVPAEAKEAVPEAAGRAEVAVGPAEGEAAAAEEEEEEEEEAE